ncbi:MAG: 50S ribosomal protein L1 [Candidatus Aenigmatarchaeota archaeon]
MELAEALAALRAGSQKKNFQQTIDLIINIKNLDMKKPESRLSREVTLPHGTGKQAKVCLIADSIGGYEPRLGKDEIAALERDKKAAKRFSREYDFFMCEPSLMILVGRVLGRYLGPMGKMPRPLSPAANPADVAAELSRSVRIRIKDSPNIQCAIGTESMPDEQIIENARKVIEEVKKALPAKAQIKNGLLKMTMSKPVKFVIK